MPGLRREDQVGRRSGDHCSQDDIQRRISADRMGEHEAKYEAGGSENRSRHISGRGVRVIHAVW